MTGTARGSNPRQPKIFGRDNVNYEGPDRAQESSVDGSPSGAQNDFAIYDDDMDLHDEVDWEDDESDEYYRMRERSYDLVLDGMSDALKERGMSWDDIDEESDEVIEFYDDCADSIEVSYGYNGLSGVRTMGSATSLAKKRSLEFLDRLKEDDEDEEEY